MAGIRTIGWRSNARFVILRRRPTAAAKDDGPIESLSTLDDRLLLRGDGDRLCGARRVGLRRRRGDAAARPRLPLKVLVPAWTLIGIAAGTALIGSDRNKVAWAEMVKLVPGTLVGIAIGLYVFTLLVSDTLAKWLGALVLAYGLYSLWGTFGAAPKAHLPPRIAAALGGLGGGMTGTVVGTMGSVFFAMYFDAIKLAKDSYRATMTAILLTLTVIRGVGYFAVGEFSRDVLDRHRDPVSVDAARHLHRQPLPPRHERARPSAAPLPAR